MTAFMSEDSIEFFVFYPPDEPEGEDYVWLVVVHIGRCFDDGGKVADTIRGWECRAACRWEEDGCKSLASGVRTGGDL